MIYSQKLEILKVQRGLISSRNYAMVAQEKLNISGVVSNMTVMSPEHSLSRANSKETNTVSLKSPFLADPSI